MLSPLSPALKCNHLSFGEPIKFRLSVDSYPANHINQLYIRSIGRKQEFLATSIFQQDYSFNVLCVLSYPGLKR